MQRIQLIIAHLVIFPFMCLAMNAQALDSRGNKSNEYILILNSSSSENVWSTVISNQIGYEIEARNPQAIVSISYAGINNKSSFLAGRFGMQAAFANGRIDRTSSTPTVLVLLGDESWMYYRIMNLRGRWENVPVVLVGVHSEIMEDYSNFYRDEAITDSLLIPLEASKNNLPVTAIIEKENETYTLWLMKQLMPDLEQVVFLSTGAYQDEFALRILRKSISVQYPELELKVVRTDRKLSEKLQAELLELPENTAVLVGCSEVPLQANAPVFQLNDCELSGRIVVGGYYPLKQSYASKTAEVVLRLYRGESADSIPFSLVDGEVPHLNTLALKRFDLSDQALLIPDVAYANIPTPFIEKNMRSLLLLALLGIIMLIVLFLNLREKHFRGYLMKSMDKYKKTYDEYQILYDNMPVGLVSFDKKGHILNRNQSSDKFFDIVPDKEKADFNLFQTSIIDPQSKTRIAKKLLVNKVFCFDDRYLRLIFTHTQDEKSDGSNILMLILDCTDIHKEKAAKERILEIFGFAMEASALGVAEYNLINKKRIATEAWYKNLCITERDSHSNVYRAVVEEDRRKIEDFLNNIGEDGEVYFAETIRVKDGNTIHWLRYVIQLLEYGPEDGRVIVAELLLNVDKQKASEQELDEALQAARESDRLKNAFIANMSSDIRPTLDELVVLSNRLIGTHDEAEKESLMEHIEQNNDLLLNYVERIIELSRTDVTKRTSL